MILEYSKQENRVFIFLKITSEKYHIILNLCLIRLPKSNYLGTSNWTPYLSGRRLVVCFLIHDYIKTCLGVFYKWNPFRIDDNQHIMEQDYEVSFLIMLKKKHRILFGTNIRFM